MLGATEVTEKEKKPRGRPPKRVEDLTAFGVWLKTSEGWDKAKIAKALDQSESHIQNLCNGHRIPNKVLALAVEHVTGGGFKVGQWEKLSEDK